MPISDDNKDVFESLSKTIDKGFARVYDKIDDVDEKVNLTNIEVAKISTEIKSLATEEEMTKNMYQVREWAAAKISDNTAQHVKDKHKSLLPEQRNGRAKFAGIATGGAGAGVGLFYLIDMLIDLLVK